uniref:J domain-containing protein n=1 Tax=Tetraselmis chuii TaxID=63592 RepID=A0A7S1T9I0_9CHLO|mmetsp:Transcript_9401/g.16934  ORF Transcript_9401/g.16934 Transcript_9401/m.16934 type:complete len:165 (+) Transcript_9401:338-832(+)
MSGSTTLMARSMAHAKSPKAGQLCAARQPLSHRLRHGFRHFSRCRYNRRQSVSLPVRAGTMGWESEPRKADVFKILGIAKSSSADEIKQAYRRKVKELHPDRNSAEDATQRFLELQEAYTALVSEWKIMLDNTPDVASTEMKIHFDRLNKEMVEMFNDYYTGIW